MANESREQRQGAGPVIIEEPRTLRRTWIVWILVLGGIIALMLFKERLDTPAEVISQYRFEQLVDEGQIANATVNYDPQNAALNEGGFAAERVDRTNAHVPSTASIVGLSM